MVVVSLCLLTTVTSRGHHTETVTRSKGVWVWEGGTCGRERAKGVGGCEGVGGCKGVGAGGREKGF